LQAKQLIRLDPGFDAGTGIPTTHVQSGSPDAVKAVQAWAAARYGGSGILAVVRPNLERFRRCGGMNPLR
jgi:hypothetical protein